MVLFVIKKITLLQLSFWYKSQHTNVLFPLNCGADNSLLVQTPTYRKPACSLLHTQNTVNIIMEEVLIGIFTKHLRLYNFIK